MLSIGFPFIRILQLVTTMSLKVTSSSVKIGNGGPLGSTLNATVTYFIFGIRPLRIEGSNSVSFAILSVVTLVLRTVRHDGSWSVCML